MIVRPAVPFTDTAVEQLRYRTDGPLVPVLEAIESAEVITGGHLTLRLLGASHQAELTTADGVHIETVACLPGGGTALPPNAVHRLGARLLRFRSHVTALPRAEYRSRCEHTRRQAAQRKTTTLLGEFPGDRDAITYLETFVGGWRTMHCYPQTGHIVQTRTDITTA